MTLRRSRRERPPPRAYRLMARDMEILAAVGRLAQATADQLCRLFFGDASTGYRRLAKLVALRLLDVTVCHQNAPNVYTLSRAGLDLLVERGFDAKRLHRSRVGRLLDSHLRRLNDVRIELIVGLRSGDSATLHTFHSDLDLRRAAGTTTPAYIPDGIAELETSAGPLALIIEIDTGTEGITAFTPKVEATVELWRAGKHCWGAAPGQWRPSVFVPSPSRARALARAIAALEAGTLWLLAEFEIFRARGARGPVFASADEVAATPARVAIAYRGALR